MDSDSSDDYYAHKKKAKLVVPKCPYLDIVNRDLLDFDFEKVCSVTLTNSNVYACLVCGQYFKGRGKGTPALIHSLDKQHHVFLNIADEKAYCLPDDYVIDDDSLDDVKFNLNPKFSKVDDIPSSAISLTGAEYYPGVVGLNCCGSNSYLTTSLHALAVVVPLCDAVLSRSSDNVLTQAFRRLIKKMWNYQNFKGVVSPQEFQQLVDVVSGKKFSTSANDPMAFLEWFLPSVAPESLIKTFSLDLPPIPVFTGEDEKFIDTLLLTDLITDFGDTSQYVVLQIRRFIANDFFKEKNRTILRFPLRGFQSKYNLLAVICHESDKIESGSRPDCEKGKFVAYVCQPKTGQWFHCDGLKIFKISPQSVGLVESYVQIWERV